MAHFVPVILSGGAGSRLWPVSREALPKPFIKLADGKSLLAKTLHRALRCTDVSGVLTVTNRDYFFLTPDEYDASARSGAGYKVQGFGEKPDAAKAEELLKSGRYSWNSGMFCFTAAAALDAFKKHAPELLRAVEATLAATDYAKQPTVLAEAEFGKAPDISFDYAVMEKAERRAVVRGKFDWSDVGSWSALAELTPADDAGNRVSGEAALIGRQAWFNPSGHRHVV